MVCFGFRRWKVGDLLMEYKKGSIVLKSGTVFDNGDVDPRPCHPSFIPIARDDLTDDVYYLVITSKVGKYTRYEDKYYLIDEDLVEAVHLEVPSMIRTYIGDGYRLEMVAIHNETSVTLRRVPVYLGGTLLDETIVTAQQRMALRSGGR